MKDLESLIHAGAVLNASVGIFPIGAAIVRGQSVFWAEQGAQDEFHMHRSDGITLKSVSPDMIDWWNADGTLYGTLERMDEEEAAKYRLADWHRYRDDPVTGPSWREFFEEVAADRLKD